MSGKFHPVTHIIFDMDGLLLDTEPRYEKAIDVMCEKFGSKYTLATKLETIGRTARDGAKAIIRNCNLPITVEDFLEQIDLEYLKVFNGIEMMPGAEELVRHLEKNKIPMAIATSSKANTFKLKTVDHKELFAFFHHIVIGSDDPEVKTGKPAPDIFQIAASRFEDTPTDPKDVLVFEDSIAGVKAALAAGMQVVWVPHPCLDVNSQEATLIIKSLTDFQPELFHLPKFDITVSVNQ